MKENEITLFQSLVDLREQLTSDYTGEGADMKEKVDQALNDLLDKQNKKSK